jgi:hypothetical protein
MLSVVTTASNVIVVFTSPNIVVTTAPKSQYSFLSKYYPLLPLLQMLSVVTTASTVVNQL